MIDRHTLHIVRLSRLQLYYPEEVRGHLESTWVSTEADGFSKTVVKKNVGFADSYPVSWVCN